MKTISVKESEKTADIHLLLKSLEEIRQWRLQKNHKIVSLLNPGIERREIEKIFSSEGLYPSEEIIALYSWRNGADEDEEGLEYPFIWYHNFLPIQKAFSERKEYQAIIGRDWKDSWFPMFSFEGEFFLADCSVKSAKGTPVLHFFIEDPDIRCAFLSLTRMAQTLSEALVQGDFGSTDAGFGIEFDTGLVAAIHKRLNPGTAFPYAVI